MESYYYWQHIARYGDRDDVNGFVLAWRCLRKRVHRIVRTGGLQTRSGANEAML